MREKKSLLRLSHTACSSRGVRPDNQDSLSAGEVPNLYMVADGVGGLPDGEIASHTAIVHGMRPPPSCVESSWDWIRHIVQQAANGVRSQPGRMGTTFTAALFDLKARELHVGHAGDSRCYLLRSRVLTQVTRDQSIGNALVGGLFSSQEAKGLEKPVFYKIEITRGDKILLCTDGVHGSPERGNGLSKQDIAARIPYGAERLVKAAVLGSHTYDNASAIIVSVR